MRKEELRKLRALPATKEMMEKGKRFQEQKYKRWDGTECTKIIPEYELLLRVQNLSGFIKVAVFLPEMMRNNIETPRYEIFLNVAGEEYITRELDDSGKERRWSTAMADNLPETPGFGWFRNDVKVFMSKDARKTLNDLKLKDSKESDKGFFRLVRWQREQKAEKTKRREEREQAPWDADMKLIPRLPKGFEEWMRKEAVRECFIFYEYDPKGQTLGYCSRCSQWVKIRNPKHNKKTVCQSCRAEAVFKAHTRIATLKTSGYYAEIIQKIQGGIVVRRLEQRQWYRDCAYTNPTILTSEDERILILENGTLKRYIWGLYKNKFHRWILDKDYFPEKRTYYDSMMTKLYKRNMRSLKNTEIMKRSAIDLWEELPTSVANYLEIEKAVPAVEKLTRIGMFRLAKDLIKGSYGKNLLDQAATELSKMLKLDKSRLKRLREMDGNVYSLEWLQYEKRTDTLWPDEMIRDFGEAKFITGIFRFLDASFSPVKCHNYLKKQMALTGDTMSQTMITWRDYIDMAEQQKMNVKCDQIARPKVLKSAHDEMIILREQEGVKKQAAEIEKKWQKVNEQCKKLKKYEFSDEEYCIVTPNGVADIVMEGTILRHCVHTCEYYFSRIQSDESYLFFLRHKENPDMPWYTLEVEPSGNIRQKRTTGDNQNKDFQEALTFLKKWQKYFRKQITEEERQLGEKADRLRKENYESLRKNGNRVWHGKLAGKLLADVLEQDFMSAT